MADTGAGGADIGAVGVAVDDAAGVATGGVGAEMVGEVVDAVAVAVVAVVVVVVVVVGGGKGAGAMWRGEVMLCDGGGGSKSGAWYALKERLEGETGTEWQCGRCGSGMERAEERKGERLVHRCTV